MSLHPTHLISSYLPSKAFIYKYDRKKRECVPLNCIMIFFLVVNMKISFRKSRKTQTHKAKHDSIKPQLPREGVSVYYNNKNIFW